MRKTGSIDYLDVIADEMDIWKKGSAQLRAGDCIAQRGTNHAWVNRGGKPSPLAAVLIDAKPAP